MFEFRNHAPFSSNYQDIYFSPEQGLEESRHVFIEGNQLGLRWAKKEHFVIGETGFGTGLNFLATWEYWQKAAERSDVLHFISVEKNPLTADQLYASHSLFPSLRKLSSELISHYPLPYPGFHRIWLDSKRVCLTLCFMDVCSAFTELEAKIDCWFLDGFSPARNPEMWSTEVFRHLARLGRPNTSVATFTAAGHVRRGLEEAGFEVSKIRGYGRKREMTVGLLKHPPWIREHTPWRNESRNQNKNKSAIIIGAGIAGAQIAINLALRGFKVDVLEQCGSPAQQASGNPRGIVSPKLSAWPSSEEDFSVTGYLTAVDQLAQLVPDNPAWAQCGVLNLVTNERRENQWRSLLYRDLPPALVQAVNAEQASEIAGISLTQSALYFPLGGWIDPQIIVRKLLSHAAITVSYNQSVVGIQPGNSGWKVRSENNKWQRQCRGTETLIIASGISLTELLPTHLPVDFIGGQTTFAQSTNSSEALRCVLQHDGYITPSRHSQHLIGATFQRNPDDQKSDVLLNQLNFDKQKRHLPDLAPSLGDLTAAHFGYRVTTSTRFPLVGAVPNAKYFQPSLATKLTATRSCPAFHPGLYVAGAFGSRGFSTAALAAEILCSEITGEPSPVKQSLKRATEPMRWISK